MANTYQNGSKVRVTATFRSTAGAVTDPTAVRMRYHEPGTTGVVTRTYLGSTHVVRSSTGVYYADLTVSTPGLWNFRWDSTGVATAAAESVFRVKPGLV